MAEGEERKVVDELVKVMEVEVTRHGLALSRIAHNI